MQSFYKQIKSKTNNVVNNIRKDNPEVNTVVNDQPDTKRFPTRMETPWWWLDENIDMDDKLNIVKTVKTKETSTLTADNGNQNKLNHPNVHNNKSTTNNNRIVQLTSPASSSKTHLHRCLFIIVYPVANNTVSKN